MVVHIQHVSEDDLLARIQKLEAALGEFMALEAKWGSREEVQSELNAARWLLIGSTEGRIDGS